MRRVIAGILSAGVIVGLAGTADAQSTKKKRYYHDSYSERFPGATPRQLKNARAFEQGGAYYETDPNAHPVGSRSWWYLKEREMGGNRR